MFFLHYFYLINFHYLQIKILIFTFKALQFVKQVHQAQMFSQPYEIRMGMIKYSQEQSNNNYPQPQIIQPLKRRQTDPQEFSDIINNPLNAFSPFFGYIFGVKKDLRKLQISSKYISIKNTQKDRIRKKENIVKDLTGLYRLIENDDRFTNKLIRVQSQFENYKKITLKNRVDTLLSINEILGNSQNKEENDQIFMIKQQYNNSLNKQIGKRISNKLQSIKSNLSIQKQKHHIFTPQYKQYLTAIYQLYTKQSSFAALSKNQNSSACYIIRSYLTLPSSQYFYQQIENYYHKICQLFQEHRRRQEQNKNILKYLPYKQSSFYWQKIMKCCRKISNVLYYSDIDTQKVKQFEAKYIGIITYNTLSKLKEREWIDSTITSSIIEYLKYIQGANNYHSNDHFSNYIFSHSETSIFSNSRRNIGENYTNYEKLIFLVNIQNSHWFVIVAYNKSKEIVVYDSMKQTKSTDQYCHKIKNRLQEQSNNQGQYQIKYRMSPYQTNTSDCGIFSIINMILAVDKSSKEDKRNQFSMEIVSQIRQSLYLFLLYLGYCKAYNSIVRKDYFDILFRSTVKYNIISHFHKQRKK